MNKCDLLVKETPFFIGHAVAARQEAGHVDMRVHKGKVLKTMHDIRSPIYKKLHHPEDYSPSQQFAAQIRSQDSWGLVYHSVRHNGGECIATLRPPAVSRPQQWKNLAYVWDSERITTIYEKRGVILEL